MEPESVYRLLHECFTAAVAEVAGVCAGTIDPALRPAGDPKFGDYQCNVAMALAKTLKAKPRDVAERIKVAVEPRLAGIAEPLETAGPGFINIRLQDTFLAGFLGGIPAPGGELPDRVGIAPVTQPQRTVVEYSQPNVAKQMHVGHLRSTIIGDVFARVLAFMGHEVIRQNHIGDWGTQFGMLIRWYREHPLPTPQTHADVLEAIEADYKAANARFKDDEAFATESRKAVAELQGGDAQALQVWEQIRDVSLDAVQSIYDRLGVLLQRADVRGESFYNPMLPQIVADLEARFGEASTGATPLPSREGAGGGLRPPNAPHAQVRRDQGAVVVYLYDKQGGPLFKNSDGEILGMIIQKSDGAYLYATTDLAAIHYRLTEMAFASGVGAQRVIYVTDARQKLHFEQFFAVARAAGWIGPQHRIDHVTFGTVMGEDRRPLKTRTGGTIKLRELLDEAEKRAQQVIEERAQGKSTDEDGAGNLATGGGPTSATAAAVASAEAPRGALGSFVYQKLGLDPTEFDWEVVRQRVASMDSLSVAEFALALDDWTDADMPDELVVGESLVDLIVARLRWLAGMHADESTATEAPAAPVPGDLARRIGVASVKYADLRNDRNTDYVFDWDKMLALTGNTAPYLLYAYARIRSIYRKAAERIGQPDVYAPGAPLHVGEPAERALALRLSRLREALDAVASELTPHLLCTYLYDLAAEFMRFYETCPVLGAADEAARLSRMRLCDLTARTLRLGLGLLGIEVIERM